MGNPMPETTARLGDGNHYGQLVFAAPINMVMLVHAETTKLVN